MISTTHALPAPRALVTQVAQAYGFSPEALCAPCRDLLRVEARRVAMQLLAEQGLGAVHIGQILGRDHSTVLHHLAVLRSRSTPEGQEMLADLRAVVRTECV